MTTNENSGGPSPAPSGRLPALPDHVYDLVVLLQQAAEDVVRYEQFAADARSAGDHEFEDWCHELADSDREIVGRARAMLVARLEPTETSR